MAGGLQSNARPAGGTLAQKRAANGRKGWIKATAEADGILPCPISPGFMAPQYWRIRFAVETYRHRRAGRDRQDRGTKAGAGAAGPYARGGRDERSGESKGMARSRRHLMPAGFTR